MLGEYGALSGGDFSANFSALFGRAVDFIQTPLGILTVVAFILLILFLTRDKYE